MADNDELRMDEITPEMLGCMGEPEIDDGVIEETQKVKKTVRLSFEQISLAKRKKYRQLYDQFDYKDMSFEDFCCELCAIQSPGLMQKDLADIVAQKHAGYQRKAAIDFSVRKQN